MKIRHVVILGIIGTLLMGCDPSKDDVCGSCSGDIKTICEAAYDACDDDGDCDLDDLEDSMKTACK